jgi:Flp pilus assembly pilin Flp
MEEIAPADAQQPGEAARPHPPYRRRAVVDRMLVRIHHLLKRDDGQDLIEYGLLAVLIATGAILAMSTVGSELNTLFWVPIANAV